MRLAPRSLTGQLALLILVAFLVAQFISLWLFTGERGTALQASLRVETAERAAAVVIALEEAAPDNRPGILAAARSSVPLAVSETPNAFAASFTFS